MPTAIPQGRACKPEEVADLAVFLASDAAKHMVGHNLVGTYMSVCGKLVPLDFGVCEWKSEEIKREA
jgi:NAD(P)-dependent dehydrogenase (short-subunit alcohol dehydrogenase family)